jgi:threonylcarbamoyladenosine tRNA methylthiotransferase MtaB
VASLPGVLRVVRNDDKERLVPDLFHAVRGERDEAEEVRLKSDTTEPAPVRLKSDRTEPAPVPLKPDTTGTVATIGTELSVRSVVSGFSRTLTTAGRDGDGACGSTIEPGVAGRTAYTLRVQTGCEQPCAYCIIPATRGAGRSVPVGGVLRDVTRIAASGFREIALTGVHLGSYGRDLAPRSSLLELLCALADSTADVVFRISSLEPMDCTPQIVDLVARSGGRFAPHFHLPLQHASDRMLALMRRPYTLDYYRGLVADVAARLPHASIGSDMIVGFPGESDDDFVANLDYLPSSPLTHLHVFPYSDRPGTAASTMAQKVDGVVVRERGRRLREIGADLARRFRASQAGTLRPGLTLEDGTLVVTDNYMKVRIPAGLARNERVLLRIAEGGTTGWLAGEAGARG